MRNKQSTPVILDIVIIAIAGPPAGQLTYTFLGF